MEGHKEYTVKLAKKDYVPKTAKTKLWNACFTWNNYSDEDYEELKLWAMEHCSYYVIGKEIGEQGTPHLQGYFEFFKRKYFTFLRGVFKNNHFKPRWASAISAAGYCQKDKNYIEGGTLKVPGRRNDLHVIKDLIETGKETTMNGLIEHISNYQGIRMAETMLKYKEPPRDLDEMPKCTVIWGDTGTGKSMTARQVCKSSEKEYYKFCNCGKWWESYDGQLLVWIDDFRGDEMIPFHKLLYIIDMYEVTIECKGGSRQLMADEFIITADRHPKDWYCLNDKEWAQLERRLTVVKQSLYDSSFSKDKKINIELGGPEEGAQRSVSNTSPRPLQQSDETPADF